jgi:hypothetical protein
VESSEDTATDVAPEDSDRQSRSKARDAPKKSSGSKRRTSSEPLFGGSSDENGLEGQRGQRPRMTKYGSIIGSPPKNEPLAETPLPSLKLPDPAISTAIGTVRRKVPKNVRLPDPEALIEASESSPSAYEAGKTRAPGNDKITFRSNPFSGKPIQNKPKGSWDRSRIKRLLSISIRDRGQLSNSNPDLPMDIYHEFEYAQADFFKYLDSELEKIEDFYKEKEDEATRRLEVLREQLHILRDRRIDDLNKAGRDTKRTKSDAPKAADGSSDSDDATGKKVGWHPWPSAVDRAWDTAVNGRIGKQTKVMESETTPEAFRPIDDRRDYERRAQDVEVSYRTAKRKLKLAMQEYYRSLELLKSYTLLNRTAFRKITKKYDKTVNARPTGRYMSERVGKSHFIKSDIIDGYITTVEDLYSRYFEAGNHKVAANKLRKASRQKQYHGGAMFRNGMTIALGTVWGVEGIVAAGQLLFHDDPTIVTQTSFLLQV